MCAGDIGSLQQLDLLDQPELGAYTYIGTYDLRYSAPEVLSNKAVTTYGYGLYSFGLYRCILISREQSQMCPDTQPCPCAHACMQHVREHVHMSVLSACPYPCSCTFLYEHVHACVYTDLSLCADVVSHLCVYVCVCLYTCINAYTQVTLYSANFSELHVFMSTVAFEQVCKVDVTLMTGHAVAFSFPFL